MYIRWGKGANDMTLNRVKNDKKPFDWRIWTRIFFYY